MSWNHSTVALAAGVVAAIAGGIVAWQFAFFFLPYAWTGEPARLADVLAIRPGMHVAEIGAGSGALALEMASRVGAAGEVHATELSPERLDAIRRRVQRASVSNVRVIEAGELETRLPDGCCEAAYMRAVFHHVADPRAFAASVARAVRDGGRVAVIDFAPGTLWFHGVDHGVTPEKVVASFAGAGFRLRQRDDAWGGGMFLLVFER